MLNQKTESCAWVKDAARLPLAFAQTREDPRLDRLVVEKLGPACRIAMIASGGCTAAYLATLPQISSIDLVDPNPAQLALTRLKLHLLAHEGPEARLELLGHTGSAKAREFGLDKHFRDLKLAPDYLGPWDQVVSKGPDHVGRYETCFQNLAHAMKPFQREMSNLLSLSAPTLQQNLLQPNTPLGTALEKALDSVLSLPNLVALFGEGATRNPVEAFSRHFLQRIRVAVAQLPAATNPFLWQMLTGSYPPTDPADWIKASRPETLPVLAFHQTFMDDFLGACHADQYDLIHLSNILDWLTPAEGKRTLELAHHALRPGGMVFIRQLNSSLEIPCLGKEFDWRTADSEQLLTQDRSFFYRSLHLGKKPCG